jgi:beta-glucanase (GH16 family)
MLSKIFAIAAIAGTTFAQTSTTCDPTKKSCPDDPALGKSVFYDMTKGAPQDFTVSTGAAPTFDNTGAVFTISKSMQSPTMSSKWYMMFGHYDVVMKAAPGQGIVSSLVLLSDDLDEVDWEFLGSDDKQVQSNYYGKGNTEVYDRGANLSAAAGTQDDFHTYSIDWTADHITWSIDGQVLRTLTPETADKDQYPQSPMQLKIGSWPAGDPSQPKGTIEWAGGPVDYSKGPFTMTVKSIKAIDYSTGESYSYGDQSGTWQSIQAKNGKVNSSGNSGAAASTVTGSGTAVTASTSGGISAAPITATTTKSGVLSSATGDLVSFF